MRILNASSKKVAVSMKRADLLMMSCSLRTCRPIAHTSANLIRNQHLVRFEALHHGRHVRSVVLLLLLLLFVNGLVTLSLLRELLDCTFRIQYTYSCISSCSGGVCSREAVEESAEAEKAVVSAEAALTVAIPAVAEGLPAMHRGRFHFPHRLASLLMPLCWSSLMAAVDAVPPSNCHNTPSSSTECLQPRSTLLVERPRRSADLDKGPGRECLPGQVA